MNIQPTRLVLLCSMLTAAPAAAKTYFKWTDDNGTVHFTAEPPNDRDYESIDTAGRVTGRSQAPAEATAAKAEPEPGDVQMPREGKPDPQLVAARCEQARQNMFWLQSKRRIVIENDDGSETFVDPEEQHLQLEQNQALINEWCQESG